MALSDSGVVAPLKKRTLLLMLSVLIFLILWLPLTTHRIESIESRASRTLVVSAQTSNKQTPVNLKVLAEGFHSAVSEPFIAVVRDAETYTELTKLDRSLPQLDAEFFKSHAVIVAYLGTRNTGGYSIDIRPEAAANKETSSVVRGCIHIVENRPGRGVMVPEMITSPFKAVSLEASDLENITIGPDEAWQKTIRRYWITAGSFSSSGGLAGTSEDFPLGGGLQIMRLGKLASLFFSLVSSDSAKEARELTGVKTVLINDEGNLQISRISAGTLVKKPNSGLKITGTFAAGESKLSLNLVSLPSMIADGYQGSGHLEAKLANSPTP